MQYQVENNVPLPPKRKQQIRYPFGQMELGASFEFDEANYKTVSNSARAYAERHGMKFTLRKIGDGKARVWRVE